MCIRDRLGGAFVSFFGPDPLGLLGVVVLTSLGTLGLPQMVHKFYTIKNEKSIKAGTIISTLFALIIAGGSYFMGAFGRLYYTPPASGQPVFDNIVPEMLAGSLPDLLIGVVMILVLSLIHIYASSAGANCFKLNSANPRIAYISISAALSPLISFSLKYHLMVSRIPSKSDCVHCVRTSDRKAKER